LIKNIFQLKNPIFVFAKKIRQCPL